MAFLFIIVCKPPRPPTSHTATAIAQWAHLGLNPELRAIAATLWSLICHNARMVEPLERILSLTFLALVGGQRRRQEIVDAEI